MGLQSLRKIIMIGLSLTMMISLLAACSKGNGETGTDTRVLRIGVLYGGEDNEPWFRQQFTDSFELLNQNIEIQIVPAINNESMWNPRPNQGDEREEQPDPYEEMQKMMTGSNPVDVVVTDIGMLRRMVQDNLLKELDPLIQQENFDISDYVPTVLEGIKAAGDNKIYALTPTFTSSAMFYNKRIFQEKGVEPPTDNMMWDDVINKARLVAGGEGEERTFGLMLNRWGGDGFWDIQNFAAPLQLRMFDDKAEKMLVNSPQWEKVWTTVIDLYREKISPKGEDMWGRTYSEDRPYNPFENDLFLSGRVAMMIGDYYYLNDLKRAFNQKDNIEGFTMVDWDVVTVPQFPEAPGIGGNIYLNQLMGINANAQNSDDAWKFIKFLNGKEWAKLKSRSTNEMVARKEFIKPREGMDYNIAAFYTLKPVPVYSNNEDIYRKYPYIYDAVQSPGQMLFQQVMEEKKTVKEALAEWETQGNANLLQMKENPDQPLQPIDMMPGGEIPIDKIEEDVQAEVYPAE
ncbi:ABC transporter substrate-binding protein [Paenibacillus tarimensis]